MKKEHKFIVLFLFLLLLPFSINIAFSATGIRILYYLSRFLLDLQLLTIGLVSILYFRPVLHYSKYDATIRQLPWGPYLVVFAFGLMMLTYSVQNFYYLIKTWNMECLDIGACLRYLR
jgi:hypothetical protein